MKVEAVGAVAKRLLVYGSSEEGVVVGEETRRRGEG